MNALDMACENGRIMREALEWIGDHYDDNQTPSELAMRCYDMACVARACLKVIAVREEQPA